MFKYLWLIVPVLATGCATVSTVPRPADYYQRSVVEEESTGSDTLFRGDGRVLSDSEIERILNYRLVLPSSNRIALLQLSGGNSWMGYSGEVSQLTDSIKTNFVERLKSTPRVFDASFLPGMLVPKERSVPYLREAAARYQADLLLAYRSSCRTYEKYRFVGSDEARAYCTVEAVLLDVRSGVAPFSSVATREYRAVKGSSDLNFRETRKKAELEAVANSLGEIADSLLQFLSTTKVR